jgi:hypothetical protein
MSYLITFYAIITNNIYQFRVFAVKSIHGHENMRDYIGFLKEAGFEFKADLN